MAGDVCSQCGRALDQHDSHDRHVRFTLPDPVFAAPDRERTAGIWMSHESAGASVMMQVPDIGAFVRVLLPVRLTGGHTLTFGLWLAIDPAELPPIFGVWWEPQYADLRICGWLANAVPPWGLLATPVETVVRDPDETPYCVRSDDPQLDAVLHDEWPHELVLDANT
jgi:hypothetical protein